MLKKNSKVNQLQDSEAVIEHLRFVRQCQSKSQVIRVPKSHSIAHFFLRGTFFLLVYPDFFCPPVDCMATHIVLSTE